MIREDPDDERLAAIDPGAWAALFRSAVAQFVVPVAEYHGGFAIYDSDRSRWTAAKMGPQRDVIGSSPRRSCELIDKYRLQLFWFAWWIEQLALAP